MLVQDDTAAILRIVSVPGGVRIPIAEIAAGSDTWVRMLAQVAGQVGTQVVLLAPGAIVEVVDDDIGAVGQVVCGI